MHDHRAEAITAIEQADQMVGLRTTPSNVETATEALALAQLATAHALINIGDILMNRLKS